MSALLPCPFCGNTNIELHGESESAYCRCTRCQAVSGRTYLQGEDDEDDCEARARDRWNLRSPPPARTIQLAIPTEPTVTTRKIADALSDRDRTELATFAEYLRDRASMSDEDRTSKWGQYERGQTRGPTPQP